MLTAGSVNSSCMEEKAVTETEGPPVLSPEASSIGATASKPCLIPKQKMRKTAYHLCKCIMRPVQAQLLLLGKSDLSRQHEEVQNFHHCIRRLGRHIQTYVRKFSERKDRDVWETNLWEYTCLYTVFDRLQLHILYRDSSRNFSRFKETYKKLRFKFLATQLLIGSFDLQQLYGAWHLGRACSCTGRRLKLLTSLPQNRQLQREKSENEARPDSRQGPLKSAVSREKHHGSCSPDTERHNLQSTSRPNPEGANSDSLKHISTD